MQEDKQIAIVNTLSIASTATAVTRELVDMLQILPAKAAASILLMIFDTIEVIHGLLYRFAVLNCFIRTFK